VKGGQTRIPGHRFPNLEDPTRALRVNSTLRLIHPIALTEMCFFLAGLPLSIRTPQVLVLVLAAHIQTRGSWVTWW